ncbi:MAG: universal stress protein [Caldimicrobium sp.]
MKTYRKILACIDGSEESFNAYKNALWLAKSLNAEVLVMTVLPVGQALSSALSLFIGMKDILRKGAEKILKQASFMAEEEGVKVKEILEEGEPFQRIIDTAYAEEVDLIVLGKTGKSGLAKGILGSTAMRTIGSSPVDCLVIPKEATLRIRKLLLPVDGSPYSERASERALFLAKAFKASVSILFVVELLFELYETPAELVNLIETLRNEGEEIVRKMRLKFKEENIPSEAFVVQGNIAEQIIEFSNKEEADLIVMGSHGKTGLKRLLLGSVTEKVINFGNKPVLVVKI